MLSLLVGVILLLAKFSLALGRRVSDQGTPGAQLHAIAIRSSAQFPRMNRPYASGAILLTAHPSPDKLVLPCSHILRV